MKLSQCRKCVYYNHYGFCDFAYRTGKLRTMLHPGERLNNPCKDFKLRGGKKNDR